MPGADYEVAGGDVAIITCQNPPVNQLSYHLRVGLLDGLEQAKNNPRVRAIVILGSGRSFPAGADISEFATGKFMQKNLGEIIANCEKSTKPVVAAIHGTALGGGLELALGCHYRIATTRSKVGFPEVLLGLLPGGGGTQRAPRLMGPLLAAELIVSGQQWKARRARGAGLIDDLVPVPSSASLEREIAILKENSIQFARSVMNVTPLSDRVISQRTVEPLNQFFYDQVGALAKKAARGHIAPIKCIEAVAASSLPFKQGLKKEQAFFSQLAMGTQSRALQHMFFAQRAVVKVPGINMKTARNMRNIGIIGCGTMGGGIAMNFIQIGLPVTILETKQQFLDRGLGIMKKNWMSRVKKGKLSKKKVEQFMSLITPTLAYSDLSQCDIVIEAVFENMDVKKKVFRSLAANTRPDCILASNTSFLNVDEIAESVAPARRPYVIGTHFFAPANKMQLLENVKSKYSSPETKATVQALGKKIKKVPVLVGNCDGFVGNRMYAQLGAEANAMLYEGVSPYLVDKVMYEFGWPMGVFSVGDLSGNDIMHHARKNAGVMNKPNYRGGIADRLVEDLNRLGQKVGKGWYDYEGRKKKESPEVLNLIDETLRREGRTKRTDVTEQEICDRLMFVLVNEGFKIVEEGIAARPLDVDIVMAFGYGFPAYRGGPMHWADSEVGLKKLKAGIDKYSRLYPEMPYWRCSRLLEQCVASGKTLAKFVKKRGSSKL